MFLVDDGSDQDYDSHIMVWQLPIVPPDTITTTTSTTSDTTDHKESRPASSLDLGPTPGSGVITVDSDDDKDVSELPENFGNDSGNDSYKNWNKDVESLLQHVAVNKDDDDNEIQIRSSPDGGEE